MSCEACVNWGGQLFARGMLPGTDTFCSVCGERELAAYRFAVAMSVGPQTLDLLRRYAEHHEADKAEPGTIDHEVAEFLRGLK